MFCCVQGVLYYSTLNIDLINIFAQNNQISLIDQFKQIKNQVMLPSTMFLKTIDTLQIPDSLQTFNLQILEYCIKVSQQTRQIQIQQLVQNPLQKVWKILKQNEQQQLLEGDVFSFDFFDFQIYKLNKKNCKINSNQQTNTNETCRICFGCQTSDQNPLLNFCNCTGSVKYIHLYCNQQWIKQNMIKRDQDNFICYTFKNIQCNLCKQKWKKKVTHHKINYYLYDIKYSESQKLIQQKGQIQERKFIQGQMIRNILLSIQTPLYQNQEIFDTGIVIIQIFIPESNQLKQHSFLIGKSQNCQLMISDFVSSTIQCSFKVKGDKFIIKDFGSMYGTHVDFKKIKYLNFNTKNGIYLRFSSSLMHFKGKNSIFQFLQTSINYSLKYSPYKKINQRYENE